VKRFKQFLHEGSEVKFRTDNPGGEWLQKHISTAEDHYSKRFGLHGGATGYFSGGDGTLKLPVHILKDLPGAMGEHHTRDDATSPKSARLEQEIGHPKNFDSKEYPILVGVNHRGKGFVMEGNHRLAYAARHGISHIHTEVRYWNGGENHPDSQLPPATLLQHHKDAPQ
jgi:hypothetical protein